MHEHDDHHHDVEGHDHAHGQHDPAAAMAMAGIPSRYEPGATTVGVGFGTWQGETAVAFGGSMASADGNMSLKLGATFDSRNRGGVIAGLGWSFH